MATYLVEGSFLPSNTASIHLNSVPFFKIKPVQSSSWGRRSMFQKIKPGIKNGWASHFLFKYHVSKLGGRLVHADYVNRRGGSDFVKHAGVILER